VKILTKQVTALSLAIPRGNLEQYVHYVKQIPVLSAEEEKALAYELRDHNNLEAARKLVLSHLRFVIHIARSYSGYGLPQADLIQEGSVGLMKAVKRYDPDQQVRLVSFAVHWIKAEIHEYILRNWKIVKIATTKAQRKLFFNLRKSKKRLGWFTNDEVSAVANDLGVPESAVREMESRLSSSDASFDGFSDNDDDGHEAPAPAAYLQDMTGDPASLLENDDWTDHSNNQLAAALESLDERSKDILAKRWLKDEKATLQELAEEYNVSAERIRQLEKNAMNKLKQNLI